MSSKTTLASKTRLHAARKNNNAAKFFKTAAGFANWLAPKRAHFSVWLISLGHSTYITFRAIMSFRKPCHIPQTHCSFYPHRATNLRFLEFSERRSMSINLNYVAWENSLTLTWSKKDTVVRETLFYSKYLKFTCLEIFLSSFRLYCKDHHKSYILISLFSIAYLRLFGISQGAFDWEI